MEDKIISYEADLDQEYETLTEKHETIKHDLEAALSLYLKERKAKPVTIQGPYGSGKTQLLYHLFKFTWGNGGIGIYAHLEKIIPSQEMGASGYADYLKELLNKEIGLLRKGESELMMSKVRDYAVNHIKEVSNSNNSIVLFVDEIEQQYKLLDGRVRTDDHSPMREVIARVNRGDAGFYIVLAFAPVSFYEFSKGEAQTGRFLPEVLPIVQPKTFRKLFGEIGNLVWWLGKGRYRGASRTRDIFKANVSNINEISRKELQDVCRNIGSIGGVPALDYESIEKIDDFNNFKEFLIQLEPKARRGEIYSGNIKIVKKCRIYDSKTHDLNNVLEESLRTSGASRVTDISYYLSILLDALSTSDSRMPLFTDSNDWKELFNMTEDIILEFEGEANLPWEDLKKLRDEVSDFSYNIRRNTENAIPLEEGYCLTPSFLRTLFPFPISSPNLTAKKIEKQRESLGDQTYLGKEERDSVSILFFLNEDKIRKYLVQESKSFLKETKALVAVNLGKEEEFDIPKLARWLRKGGRLRVITPRGILSDFLASFFYWIRDEKQESLPVASLFKKLAENQSVPEKDKARKISYYSSRVKEYLDSELPKLPPAKYLLRDKTGFDPKIGFASEVMGFAFVDNKSDWEAIYKFRSDFESTQFVQAESSKKQTGVPTALENLVIEDKRTKAISTGAVLRRVNDSFGKHLPDLRDVVEELNRDEFATIPVDEDSKLVFEGIFLYLKEWEDPSKAEGKFQEEKSNWGGLTSRIDKLSAKIKEFEKSTGRNIPLTHSLEADKTKIASIGNVLGEYQTKASPYTKFLLSIFIDRTIAVVEPKLNEIDKNFEGFLYSVGDEIKRYRSNLNNTEVFEKDTLEWVNKSRDEIQDEFQQKFKEVCHEFTKGGKISLENIPDVTIFTESVGEIADELQTLGEINEDIKQCKAKAEEINEKLREWEAK